MRLIVKCCCGLDVHKKNVVAAVRLVTEQGELSEQVRTFSTVTQELLALMDWLLSLGVTHVAMEATGVYWKPVYNLFEDSFQLLLVNPSHFRNVPGRKTDVTDAAWLAELLAHGLLKASFVPERGQRELRELTRYRTSLIRDRTREVNRLQKTLEGANIKLGDVASDIMGLSARQMLSAMVAGNTDPQQLARLAKGRMKEKIPQLQQALVGSFGEHQRFLVALQLAHIEELETLIAQLDEQVRERLGPFDEALERLDAIPGIGRRTAEAVVAEIGTDMSRFPTAKHLASWAGMCPGNHRSAGKRKSGKTRKGSPWLKSALTEAAHAAGRTKGTYLSAQYRRFAAGRNKKRATVAVGHALLGIIYHLLKEGTTYQDLGPTHFDERDRQAVIRRSVRRLEDLGYQVTVEELAPAA
jgi:transposase